MAADTRRLVASLTFGLWLMTLETVILDTPAASATSWIVVILTFLIRQLSGGVMS